MIKYSIVKRIYQFLRSDDLEMVQLGCNLLALYIPKKSWEKLINSTVADNIKIDTTFGWSNMIKRWYWVISEEEIYVRERNPYDEYPTGWAGPGGVSGYSGTVGVVGSTGTPGIVGTYTGSSYTSMTYNYTSTGTYTLPINYQSFPIVGSTITINLNGNTATNIGSP